MTTLLILLCYQLNLSSVRACLVSSTNKLQLNQVVSEKTGVSNAHQHLFDEEQLDEI